MLEAARLGQTDAAGSRAPAALGQAMGPSMDPVVQSLAVASQEGHHIFQAEAAIPPLADTVERQLTTVAEPLDRVDMQMEELSHLTRGEHGAEIVRCHGRHLTFLI